jgi:hypothetical protein
VFKFVTVHNLVAITLDEKACRVVQVVEVELSKGLVVPLSLHQVLLIVEILHLVFSHLLAGLDDLLERQRRVKLKQHCLPARKAASKLTPTVSEA